MGCDWRGYGRDVLPGQPGHKFLPGHGSVRKEDDDRAVPGDRHGRRGGVITRAPRGRVGRIVTLRHEVDGPDTRHLWAHIDQEGNLHIDGQDLGPKTAIVSADGEYEWFQTIDRSELPKLSGVLGGKSDDDILDVLEENWTGPQASELEALLRESDIEVDRFVWSG